MKNTGLQIYIAEDDPLVRMGFEAQIRLCGHKIAGTSGNGAEAIQEIIRLKPDVMILDIDMPEYDGITVAEKVNKVISVPAVIVTGYRSEEYADRASRAGIYAYLQKPIDEYELRLAINIAHTQHMKQESIRKEKMQAEQKLKDRVLIERAKGFLMDQFGLSDDQAMKALQKRSENSNTRMAEVARDILDKGKHL